MSAILSADDLNDFISPGVACIKPVEIQNEPKKSREIRTDYEIEIDIEGHVMEVTKEGGATNGGRLQEAQISLADCLACSGCITSAEEVLVAQHSYKELLNALTKEENQGKKFVISLSHQSRASLAGALNLSVEEVDKLLIHLFINKYRFSKIVGTGLGRKISIEQITHDLINEKSTHTQSSSSKGPKLTSICPGWVLYAEKTHPYIIPRINNVKSPQQITGVLLKKLTSAEYQINESEVYHLSIMPCFDKKLEAARPEKDGSDEKDVDCVITPKELITMLQEDEEVDIDSIINEIKSDSTNIYDLYNQFAPNNWYQPIDSWLNDEGSSSGGYALQYLINLKSQIVSNGGGVSEDRLRFEVVEGRNSDIYVIKLMQDNTKLIASAGVVNGFRNIQNLVRKLKLSSGSNGKRISGGGLAARRKARELAKKGGSGVVKEKGAEVSDQAVEQADASKCDLVEIMACPGGCINGGGQISGPKEVSQKDWTGEIEELYRGIPVGNSGSRVALTSWVGDFLREFGISEERMIRTYFKEVEKPKDATSIALGSKW